MIERVVENWLTSANERGYEIPFCQLLAFRGHRILHLSSHGPQEQGKDIITIAPDGVPCAYQLKGERNIGLATWRSIRGEIEELIEIPIQHPSVPNDFKDHRAYLVNNGLLADTVRREIHDRNRAYKRRRLPTLNLILRGDLHKDFVEIHGRFLPTEPADFRRFLELYLADGRGMLPEKRLADFLTSILPIKGNPVRKLEIERALASSLVLTGYALSPYVERRNHVAVVTGWVLMAAHVLAVASKSRVPKKHWRATFDLCVIGIEQGLRDLVSEVLERKNFLEGDPLTDGITYRARMTLLLGYITAYANYIHLKGESFGLEPELNQVVEKLQEYLVLWGESAVPAFLSVAWFLERQNQQLKAEQLVLSALHTIVLQNNPMNNVPGLPDPYHSVESTLLTAFGLDDNEGSRETYKGHSYSMNALIEWLARRLRRQSLARLWSDITRITCTEVFPEPPWATYLWESEKGPTHDRFPRKPESWKRLLDEARGNNFADVPDYFQQLPGFLLVFLLVYPHRLRSELVRLLDHAFEQAD
jgi:hypothetical protein